MKANALTETHVPQALQVAARKRVPPKAPPPEYLAFVMKEQMESVKLVEESTKEQMAGEPQASHRPALQTAGECQAKDLASLVEDKTPGELQASQAAAEQAASDVSPQMPGELQASQTFAEQSSELKWYYWEDGEYCKREWGPWTLLTMRVWHTMGVIDDGCMVRRCDWTEFRTAKSVFEKLTKEQLDHELVRGHVRAAEQLVSELRFALAATN